MAAAMELFLKFSINAARRLPKLPQDHICSRLHGHTFDVELHVDGPVDPVTGWVIDFADLDPAVNRVKEALDHRYLNDVTGLDNPTSENIAIWIWRCVETEVDGLSKVVVMEGHDFGCIYRGPDESR